MFLKKLVSVMIVISLMFSVLPVVTSAQSSSDMSLSQLASLISSLQSIVNSLKSKVAALKGTSSISIAQAQSTGLVAAYSFNEGSGTSVIDSSGSSNTATLVNGPTWAAGKYGNAVNFDGSDDYANAGSAASLDDLQNFTYSVWIYPRTLGESIYAGIIIEKAGGSGFKRLTLADNVNNNFRAEVELSGSTAIVSSAAWTISLNQWQYITMTYNNGTITLYKDGILIVSGSGGGSLVSEASGNLLIGNNAATSRTFNGLIDEVRIYNRALTQSEIQSDMDTPVGGTPPPTDTIAPTVSISAPTYGSTVSGSLVTVSANASDNVGVFGVQFKLDGATLGSEDISSPYSIIWNTTTAINGYHTLTATARDASGNTITSSEVTITVSNVAPPPDTQAPSIPSNLAATTVSSSQINLSWTASTDNVGVANYRVYRAGSQIGTPSGTNYADSGLSPTTTYSYTVAAVDAAGNVSAQSSNVSATTQVSTLPPPTGTITLDDFSGPRPNPGNDNVDIISVYNGEDPGQTYTISGGQMNVRGTPGVYWQFLPYPYTGTTGFAKGWIESGTWDTGVNRLRLSFVCATSFSKTSSGYGNIQFGTYVKAPDGNPSNQGAHYYHNIDPNVYAGKRVYIDVNRTPQHQVGQSPSTNWPENPSAPSVNYFDGLTRFYFDSQIGDWSNCTYNPITFAKVTGEPDQQVASVTYQYTGSRYEVTWSGPKNSNLQFDVAYSPNSMKTAGFASGTSGGTISATGNDYTNVIWASSNMAESSSGMYVAIRPQGQSSFTEVYIPHSSGTTPPITLVGDLNSDRIVNSLDWSLMNAVWATNNATADLNRDGIVNSLDFSLLNSNWGRTN